MSGEYLGDFVGDETLVVVFDTFDSNGASVTMTDLATTDIEIYKGSSITQRASDAGFTLIDTDGIDLDGATGIHGFTVDLSDNTDAGFYAAQNDYYIVVNAVTIDSQTVRFIAARFSIDNRGLLRPTTATRTLDVTAGGTAGIDWGNVENPTTAVDLSGTDIQLCDTITTYTGNTVQTGDSFARLGAPAGASVSADIAALPTAAENTTDIMGNVMENSETFAEQIRIMRAESAGKVAVSGATVTFRDAADSKDRITATTDANGQRTAVTVDGS